jgi:hypothetical protein
MRKILIIYCLLSLVSCHHSGNQDERNSIEFYNNYRFDFLQSKLMKYGYDPRTGFACQEYDSTRSYKVLIRKDSSILIYYGYDALCEDLNFNIESFEKSSVILEKKNLNGNKGQVTYTFTNKTSNNSSLKEVVDYFLNLSRLINKYKIIAIQNHPKVNIKKIIFSENDYLIYKPDSLIFQSSDTNFMTYLFDNGKYLDNNWVHFSGKVDIDYY